MNDKKQWSNNACCFAEDFIAAFLSKMAVHKVHPLLINKLRARQDWRSGLTGAEAFYNQLADLLKESEYAFVTQFPKRPASNSKTHDSPNWLLGKWIDKP